MPEPSQLTIDGRHARPTAPTAPQSQPPVRLFTAPATIRGQLALPTDQPALVRASLIACPDATVQP